MPIDREIFEKSGPVHLLTCFDWRNTFHRTSLVASLVQGVYILERDRQRVGKEQETCAPPWWERFHFLLHKRLEDDSDLSYFGAIFKLKDNHPYHGSNPYPPKYVIAFRGTMTRSLTRSDDMILNLKSIFDKLQGSSRFQSAFKAVRDTVAMNGVGPTNVWIAGHSLGASIATLVGRDMVKKSGYQLETFLFNPPFITVPVEKIVKNETLKLGIRFAGSLLTVGIATAINHCREEPVEDPFTVLSEWSPYVFVNAADPICAEYIAYFEHREKMEEIGVGKIERIATRFSIASLVSGAVGRESDPHHLLPTAYMTKNISPSKDLKQAHGIPQWWQPHVQWQSKLYKFK